MAKIIRFRGDRHRQTQVSLPWYVMNQLDDGERAEVEAHLADCAACRRELEVERELAAQVVSLPLNADAGWAAVSRRMHAQTHPSFIQRTAHALKRLFSRSNQLRWFVAVQLMVLVVVGSAYVLTTRPAAEYHALSDQPAYGAGNVIAIFRPDVSEQQFRATLIASGARLVDGPTASGAYVLRVPDGERAAILSRLQQNKDVVLAQPIDAEPAR
jgi:hypothetical protein